MYRASLIAAFAALVAIYVPATGHGFIADDFRWILESRARTAHDVVALFGRSIGFYRPVVSLTFAADAALFGTDPRGYGLTNVAFAAAAGWLLYRVLRALALRPGAAAFGTALWLFNPHGMNTAILWASGRTALLLIAFALGAALAMLRGRLSIFLLCLAGALFSKEEAIVLPAILLTWRVALGARSQSRFSAVGWIGGSAAVLIAYAILRASSGAMTPATAPPYYAFTSDPRLIARNAVEYLDRGATLAVVATAFAFVLLPPVSPVPPYSARLLICGVAWFAAGYAITVFLPVRSSLYACLPSIGACLIAADVCARRWAASGDAARVRAAAAGILIIIALAVIVDQRSRDFVANGDFSSAALADLVSLTRTLPDGSAVVIEDDRTRRPNIESAFGAGLEDGYQVMTGRRLQFWVDPPVHGARLAGLEAPCDACVRLRLRVLDRRIVRDE